MIFPQRTFGNLETVFVVVTREVCPTGSWWIEAREAANIPQCSGQSSQLRTIWSNMSIVPRLRNPDIGMMTPQFNM